MTFHPHPLTNEMHRMLVANASFGGGRGLIRPPRGDLPLLGRGLVRSSFSILLDPNSLDRTKGWGLAPSLLLGRNPH